MPDDPPLEVHRPAPGFAFCRAELGADDATGFVSSLPPIDLVYCSPPNPDTLRWWRGYAKLPYAYADFFDDLTGLLDRVNAPECYVEVGKVRDRMLAWLQARYPHVEERPILYAAPADGKSRRLARQKNASAILLASREPRAIAPFTASDELVENVLAGRPPLRTFDPCIGRGLLLRACVAHGHDCYGIDADAGRLASCLEWLAAHRRPA